MAIFETVLKSDLKKPVHVKQLSGNLFSGDNQGNKITVEVLDNGSPATLSGGVTGYIIRPDNATLTVTGSISGNKASIVLPASAYMVVGDVSIVVKVGTTTVGACTSYVYRTTTDTLVDPGQVVPSIEELLALIGDTTAAKDAANTAASLANTKAELADTKATLADTKAGLANTAAGAANTAAEKIDNMTVSVVALAEGEAPTVTITEVNGHKHITFGVPKGDTGEAFHIVKTYASVSAMNADYSGTDVKVGEHVMVVSNVEDPDNAKVYIKGSEAYNFVVDMSGSAGIQGQAAYVHIRFAEDEPTQDSDVKTTPDAWIGIYSGTSSTAPTSYQSYTWYQFKGDKGDTGATGATGAAGADGADGASAYVHIRWAANQPSSDSDMKTTADDWMGIYSGSSSTAPTSYQSYTWVKVKGETGSAANVYGNTIEMSSTDHTKVDQAIAAKITAPETPGTSGQVLTSDGNGGQSWETPSGGTVTDVQEDGTSILNNGVANILTMTGAGSNSAGTKGLVPAPASGDQGKFLKGNGTWDNVPDPQVMTGATSSAAGSSGLVPAPAITDRQKFLCGDGSWAIPDGGKLVVFELDTVTNSGGSYTHTTTLAAVTHDMKAVAIEVSDADAFGADIEITTADGSITLSCDEVNGTSDVTVSCLFIANASAITSSEFDVLSNRIGSLSALNTEDKSNLVSAVNELNEQIGKIGTHGTSGATASKVSIGNVSWTKVGQLVSLYIDCTATAAISSGDIILEGLPKSAINFPVVNLWNYSDTSVIVANVSNGGDLIVRTAIANGKKIRGNAVYLSQN